MDAKKIESLQTSSSLHGWISQRKKLFGFRFKNKCFFGLTVFWTFLSFFWTFLFLDGFRFLLRGVFLGLLLLLSLSLGTSLCVFFVLLEVVLEDLFGCFSFRCLLQMPQMPLGP